MTDDQIEDLANSIGSMTIDGYFRFGRKRLLQFADALLAAAKPASEVAKPASGVDYALDAARYRFLRESDSRDEIMNEFVVGSPHDLDEAIDASIAQRAKEQS